MKMRCLVLFAIGASLASSISSADAAFHLWYIKEAYSNPSGSVQFVELFTAFNTQEFVGGQTLTSTANIFTFPANSPSPTLNHHVLLATAGFSAISGGATPDFTLPSNFFNPASDTLTFAGFVDEKTFTNAPIDGINSLNFTGQFSASTVAVNSPRNYAGDGGSINLSAPSSTGDYNGDGVVNAADYTLWRNTLTQTASPPGSEADGNSSGTIDAADFDYWRARFGDAISGAGSGISHALVPEPAALLLALSLLAFLPRSQRTNTRGV